MHAMGGHTCASAKNLTHALLYKVEIKVGVLWPETHSEMFKFWAMPWVSGPSAPRGDPHDPPTPTDV